VQDEDICKLVEGFGRFRARHFESGDNFYQRLSREGQSPRIMVIACCDSRVDPAIITDCDPGDLFVVRNVANLVPPCETGGNYHGTSAALEFAVRTLEVRHVIVLGHSRCGGIGSLLRGRQAGDNGQFIQPWMQIAAEAETDVRQAGLDPASQEAARLAEQSAVRVSLRNLNSFTWVRERAAQGQLQLHGWYFDLDNGELLRYSQEDGRYLPLR
jgi:carbonic anhydrase